MKNQFLIRHNSKNLLFLRRILFSTILSSSAWLSSTAQIGPNAVNADPSAKAITQVPLGSTITGDAVLKFKFTNENTSNNGTGQIPANSVRLTLSFPGAFAYTSANNIPKFFVEDADPTAFGAVHLVNNQLIGEGEVIDLLINVRALANGTGTVTFNSDRTTPVTVANLLTSNDNSSSTYTANLVLPLTLVEFKASQQACMANIVWKTAAENNIANYTVQVSRDNGNSFTSLGSKTAMNGAADNNYQFAAAMEAGVTYLYRLQINEKDGQVRYSDIYKLISECDKSAYGIAVYPSPARSNITLTVSDPSMLNKQAMIIDATGRTYQRFVLTSTTKTINIESLPAGTYILRMENGSTAKFLKL